ncbi:TylF/MycF family methyltransferase [bacterium]|nr:TylF/MycF family methyltransferase [bacterium]
MNKNITRTDTEQTYQKEMESFFMEASGTINDKLANFSRFVSRQTLAIFLYKYELFKQIIPVHGSIIELGVFRGGGSFSFAQLSAILEPYNYQRKIVGFDTFEGFPSVASQDSLGKQGTSPKKGDFYTSKNFKEELEKNVSLYDSNRFINNVEKLSFVKGDINQTLPQYIKENPHTVISLAYFDMDIYEPTKKALETILPRIPKGGIVAFDEVNNASWPGETLALLETVGLKNVRLQKFVFEPCRSYFVVE